MWNIFKDLTMQNFEWAQYKDTSSDNVITFIKFDYGCFEMLFQFIEFIGTQEGLNMDDPCTWTTTMWNN